MAHETNIEQPHSEFKSDARFEKAERCWCGWKSKTTSRFSSDYLKCDRCGTHYANRRIKPEAVSSFYSYESYWQKRQLSKKHPNLEERRAIIEEDGRVDKWLASMGRYTASPGTAIEVGCAEGSLLHALNKLGWKTVGIEPDPNTVDKVKEKTGLDVRPGVFPDVDNLPKTELFIACDVIEHTGNPVAFIKAAHRQLNPSGVLYLQLPLIDESDTINSINPNVFDPEEHAYIFTRSAITTVLNACDFDILENDDCWQRFHEITIARRRERTVTGHRYIANLGETFSREYCEFIDTLNELAEPLGLRTFCNWAKIWEYPRLWYQGLDQLNWKGLHLLDIGSEQSPWPWLLALKGARVTLIETKSNWVEQWEAVRQKLEVNVDWIITESSQLPIESASIDTVTSLSVIEHQENKETAINEIVRVLKPGGYLGISFDICEPDYGMTYPDWGGTPLTLSSFEQLIWFHHAFGNNQPPEWNREDIDGFLAWHQLTAAHHNYVTGAALLRKIQ